MSKTYAPCRSCGQVNRYEPTMAATAKCGGCGARLTVHGAIADVDGPGLGKLVAASPLPVVVDFWAPWCGPCLAFAPTFEQFANRSTAKFVFAKVDTQAQPDAGGSFGIRGIPTLIVFQDGKEKARKSGAMDSRSLEQWLTQVAAT